MKIVELLEEINEPFKNAVIAIGNFDGVHIGHQAIFHEVIEKSEAIGGASIAMTFELVRLQVMSPAVLDLG
jgi:riboflavin kinase / FMN adenylyltransferase